jgi:hypothetical protein
MNLQLIHTWNMIVDDRFESQYTTGKAGMIYQAGIRMD